MASGAAAVAIVAALALAGCGPSEGETWYLADCGELYRGKVQLAHYGMGGWSGARDASGRELYLPEASCVLVELTPGKAGAR